MIKTIKISLRIPIFLGGEHKYKCIFNWIKIIKDLVSVRIFFTVVPCFAIVIIVIVNVFKALFYFYK